MARLASAFAVLAVLAATAVACSSSSTPAASTAPSPQPTAVSEDDAAAPADTQAPDAATPPAQPADACGEVPKSQCTPANAGSVIRGIVKFDPAHFAGKKAPALQIFLHHQVTVAASEAMQGGHPHVYKTFAVKDVSKGEATFAIDLCELGTAMYSEENCGFNLVVMLDEDGSNDPDANGASAMVPQKGELVKLTPLEISCHTPSPCMTIQADCVDGPGCTTFEPLKACKCGAQSCPSDDKICTK